MVKLDFYSIQKRRTKKGIIEVFPDFKVCRSEDLMIRGHAFYAVWNEATGLWSTDEYDIQKLVDKDLWDYREKLLAEGETNVQVKAMSDFSSGSWKAFQQYIKNLSDNSHQLDESLTFANTQVKKTDYVSKRLPYSLEEGSYDAFDELIGTLYDPEERAKLEWAIGAIVSGDSRTIQKFIVLYGDPGTGKSTILNVIQQLFEGYYTSFEAKALTSASNAFSTEVFKSNPLVAIQHDGDLSRIEDNTKLNSIVSHEEMTVNEKYKSSYTTRFNCFLFLGTNYPVRISNSKSGIIRRMIDVIPSGRKIPPKKYQALVTQIGFELGAIAHHCLQVYHDMGKNYYNGYRPIKMILQTDVFFNFVEAYYFIFQEQDGVSLKQAYDMYKQYCDETLVDYKLPRHKFREELKSYFKNFSDVSRIEGKQVRSYYSGFLAEKFDSKPEKSEEHQLSLVLDCEESLFDKEFSDCPAQYANDREIPSKPWDKVTTKLSDIDTRKIHYVKVPENHIVIDFDLKDSDGNKSVEKNLEAASKWPATYAEFSKGGAGVHLHYIYDGDASKLSRLYSEGIEIKVFTGKSSLRRRLTKCNNVPIAKINSGLPMKEEKMINANSVKSEKSLRKLIERNLRKEIHPGTKPSIDFIYKILDDAYKSGMHYDVSDMYTRIFNFAMNSTHQSEYCINLVGKMKFKSDEPSQSVDGSDDIPIAFFDIEVFPNLFLVNWKYPGENNECFRMINPSSQEVEELFKYRLIGFNCRRYDNHILYARYLGYTNEQLYNLSQAIIGNDRNALFGEAYNISYTDVYDFCSKKQSLKKWEIELGIHHQELGLPWDQPVSEDLWDKVAEYCDNDVIATEAVFNARHADFVAREILADLSGLSVNDSTQQHAAKIIFGNDPHPQDKFVYTDLSEMFPGYVFDAGKSTYRGEEVGEGGYVYAEEGVGENVALLDVASMHPTSIEQLNLFGPYTKNFSQIKQARIYIKHGEFDEARSMLNGTLAKYLNDESEADNLAYALKIIINIIYGLTSAKFPNKFNDPRNVDNIVAKRGALFMIDLKHEVQNRGFKVLHIKTDSIKIPNATPEIIQFVMDFGKKYGYTFEHEATYSRICLVNDAVYIARYSDADICQKMYNYVPKDNEKHPNEWTATGAQFQEPYVFKELFSHEPIEFKDLSQTKTVTSSLYLDFNESLPDDEHNYQFVGRAGSFVPVKQGSNGGLLLREKDGKYYAVGGSKGYRWKESEVVANNNLQDSIDMSYYDDLCSKAISAISDYCDFNWFVNDSLPWEE